MRPLPFTIEIPERPTYIPNSGPLLAPISLVPENKDTGWVIAETVEFKGTSRYIITPRDNPMHRRVVKREHILDWVSAKAYEDYEFEQFKAHEEKEKEEEARLLAKAVELKARRWTHDQAKRAARAKARTAMLNQAGAREGRNLMSITYSSTSEMDSEEPNEGFSTVDGTLTKRKHRLLYNNVAEVSVKRRAIIASRPGLLQQRLSQIFADLPQRGLPQPFSAGENGNGGDDLRSETEELEGLNSKLQQSDLEYPPILPLTKRVSGISNYGSRNVSTTKSALINNNYSSTVTSSRNRWSISEPKGHTEIQIPERPPSADRQQAISAINGKEGQEVIAQGINAPYQPPLNPLKTEHSGSPIHFGQIHPRHSRLSHTPQMSHHKTTSQNISGNKSMWATSKIPSSKKTGRNRSKSAPSEISNTRRSSVRRPIRAISPLIENGQFKGQEKVSAKLHRPHLASRTTQQRNYNRPRQTTASSQAPPRGSQPDDEESENESADDDEDTWQIHGLLDDDMRLVNGDLIHYYLVDWVGDWDPTWEPEMNVSRSAIKDYQNKQAEIYRGLDGAAGEELDSHRPDEGLGDAPGRRGGGTLHGDVKSGADEAGFLSAGTSVLFDAG